MKDNKPKKIEIKIPKKEVLKKKATVSSPSIPNLDTEELQNGIPIINDHFFKKYKIKEILGSGSYGVAVKVFENFTNVFHCIKITPYYFQLRKDFFKKKFSKNEIHSLRFVCHIFCVLRLSTLFIQRVIANGQTFKQKQKEFFEILKVINNKKTKEDKIKCLMKKYHEKIESYKNIVNESFLNENSKEIFKLTKKEKNLNLKTLEEKVQNQLINSIKKESFLEDLGNLTKELGLYSNKFEKCFREAQKIEILQTKKENFLTLYYTWREENEKKNLFFLFQKTKLYNKNLSQSLSILGKDCREYVMFCLVNGIKTMHDSELVHLDIKKDNILVKISNNKVSETAICDFGTLSSLLKKKKEDEPEIMTFKNGKKKDRESIYKVAISLLSHWKNDQKRMHFYNNLKENSKKEEFLKNFLNIFPMKSKLNLESRGIVDEFERRMEEMEKKHKEEIKAIKEEMEKTHKEEIKAIKEEMEKNHREEIKAIKEEMEKKHREEIKAIKEEMEKNHREEIKAIKEEMEKKHKEEMKKMENNHRKEMNEMKEKNKKMEEKINSMEKIINSLLPKKEKTNQQFQ